MTKCSQIGLFPSLCRTVIAAHEPICRLPADSAPARSEPARRAAASPDAAHGLRGRAWEPLGVQGGADTTARPGQTGLDRSLTEPGGGRRPEQGGAGSRQQPEALVSPSVNAPTGAPPPGCWQGLKGIVPVRDWRPACHRVQRPLPQPNPAVLSSWALPLCEAALFLRLCDRLYPF